jgi:molybdopterin-binding protein
MDDLLTATEAADLLHLHVKRVQALARDGKLPAIRYGRKWLFPRHRLLQLPPAAGAPVRRAVGVDISARNQLRGTIVALAIDGVMAEVRIRIGDQELVSVITRGSAQRLGLREGEEVLAVIKSTEVMIAKEAGGE